jgi:hypothetical protein
MARRIGRDWSFRRRELQAYVLIYERGCWCEKMREDGICTKTVE